MRSFPAIVASQNEDPSLPLERRGLLDPIREMGSSTRGENQTSHPLPGQILLYAVGLSEPELLVPYGACAFSSKIGRLAGNHFLTIISEHELLGELGRLVLWEGTQDCVIDSI